MSVHQPTGGKSLKSQIFNAISCSKLHSFSHLLKHATKKEEKYEPFRSENTEMRSEMDSPQLKTTQSVKKLSQSLISRSKSKPKSKKKGVESEVKSRDKCDIQRTFKKGKSSHKQRSLHQTQQFLSNAKGADKSREQIRTSSKAQILKEQLRVDRVRPKEKVNFSQSKDKTSSKVHLQSILEKSSSSEMQNFVATPSGKKTEKKQQNSTKRKDKSEYFSEQFRKKLTVSFKQPEVYQNILKTEAVKVSYRILKKKLLEIQIYPLKSIQWLQITLEKGNLECQSIQQEYHRLPVNTVLSLFTSIRDFSFDNLFDFPKLYMELNLSDDRVKMQRYITIPYTWLHYIEQSKSLNCKKSRIRTKICVQNLPLNAKNFRVLSELFHNWSKREYKDNFDYECRFVYQEQEFQLKIHEHMQFFDLELEGRGEERLTKMIEFFSHLLS